MAMGLFCFCLCVFWFEEKGLLWLLSLLWILQKLLHYTRHNSPFCKVKGCLGVLVGLINLFQGVIRFVRFYSPKTQPNKALNFPGPLDRYRAHSAEAGRSRSPHIPLFRGCLNCPKPLVQGVVCRSGQISIARHSIVQPGSLLKDL